MTQLQLYDTMAREKRVFRPADPKRVRLYACGPTVYSYVHIGNGRMAVAFDLLFRVLRQLYGAKSVVYARNITDVDDKINQAAIDSGQPISAITDKFTRIYHQDMATLGCLPPDIEPRATAHIEAMLELIDRLVRNNKAYAAEGHVLFDVASFSDYGKLSGRSLEDMIAGARVEVAPYKKNPADFVLWKPSKPGEPAWDSPWGPGRPGWHLECSAMIEKTLGPLPIDIHGGGHDLIFPHHENEIAQSRCADQAPALASYWMHNGFLTMDAEKMSKSLGNVLLVHELIRQVPGEAIRWALLSGHYRQPLDWNDALIEQARKSLDRLYGVLERARDVPAEGDQPAPAFLEALYDDLNTPKAFAELFALAGELETAASADRARAKGALLASANLIGFLEVDPEHWFQGGADVTLKDRVEALIAARAEARKAKDWAEADRIRGELTELGVEVMDGPQGATWRLKDVVTT
jgi:cysteinyl-tRNA synthetase